MTKNTLDEVWVHVDKDVTYAGAFEFLGKKDAEGFDLIPDFDDDVQLRTTSVRAHPRLLAAFDTLSSRFGESRNDTFAIAVNIFIGVAVSNYVSGSVSVKAAKQSDVNLAELFLQEHESFVQSLDCDDDVKEDISRISRDWVLRKMSEALNVAD